MTPDDATRSLQEGIAAANASSANGKNGASNPAIGVGRTLPHSIEAEESLLSCCLLDGADVIRKAREAGITDASFYFANNGEVYRTLCRLMESGKPTEAYAVAEELKSCGRFTAIGGMAFLAQISSAIPTTAQASYFIEKVAEQNLLREIIKSSTRTVEDCHNFSGDLTELISSLNQRFTPLVTGDSVLPAGAISAWAIRRAGFGRPLKDEEPTVWLGKTAVFNRSNIGLVTALRKSGKTAVCGGVLGAIVAGPDPRGDTLGFRSSNPHGHAVIHFDTEQSPKDHEALLRTILRRAEVETCPDWLYSYGVKGVSVHELHRMLRRLLRETNRLHKGVHTVALDGVSEFVTDPNDPKECNPFVTDLESISSDFNCSIPCLLHLNPTKRGEPTKGRGHLGSQLERKCETELRINTDENGTATVYTECARHSPIREKDGFRFSWDMEVNMHLSCQSGVSVKDAAKRDKLSDLAEAVFQHAGKERVRYGDLLKAISQVAGVGASRAEVRYTEMKSFGLISKDLIGFWGISPPRG